MLDPSSSFFFFFNDPPTTEISPLPLHDALPISPPPAWGARTSRERPVRRASLPPAPPPERTAPPSPNRRARRPCDRETRASLRQPRTCGQPPETSPHAAARPPGSRPCRT